MKYLIIPIILLLSGCSWFTTDALQITTKPADKVPLILPEVDVYKSRPVKWLIVTPDNYQEVLTKLKNKGSVALFALTPKDYENASLNTRDTFKLVRQLQNIIDAYQKYYSNDFTIKVEQELKNNSDISPEDKIPEIE